MNLFDFILLGALMKLLNRWDCADKKTERDYVHLIRASINTVHIESKQRTF